MNLAEKYFKKSPYTLDYLFHREERDREIEKTYYISDKKEQLKKLQELLKENTGHEVGVYINNNNIPNIDKLKKIGIKDHEEYFKLKQRGLLFNTWVEVCRRRQLELEIYIMNILEKAPILTDTNKEEVIFYFIDQKYKEHKNVLSTEYENLLYEEEYNNIIIDVLQDIISKIDRENTEKLMLNNHSTPIKKIVWNHNKNILGTLFAILLKNDIIKTDRANLARVIQNNFIAIGSKPQFSFDYLYDNLQMKEKDEKTRPQYDKELYHSLKNFIQYIKTKKNQNPQK